MFYLGILVYDPSLQRELHQVSLFEDIFTMLDRVGSRKRLLYIMKKFVSRYC